MQRVTLLTVILVFCFISCRRADAVKDFKTPENDNIVVLGVPENKQNMTIINVNTISDMIDASDLIEEVRYIPLETKKKSLIGYYRKILIHNDKIFIMDDISAEAVLVFDMDGKFLYKVGAKGGAPNEFYNLAGMSIDRQKNELIIYDNRKRKMMYFSLNGEFIKSKNVNYRFYGSFGVLPSGDIVSCTNKSCYNTHLDQIDDYRLLYSDSTGSIVRAAFQYDDNAQLPMAWSDIIENGNELLYHPCFTNKLYDVSDSTVQLKYSITLHSKYSTFDVERLHDFNDVNAFNTYWSKTKNLDNAAENETHLYFSLSNNKGKTYCFYNKDTKNLIAFDDLSFDNDWIINFPVIYAHKEHFIATVTPRLLKMVKMRSDNLSPDVQQLIDSADDDDNPFLVFFKLKDF